MALALVTIAMALGLIVVYNRLAQLNVQADNAWADINVQLKRRHDLIPNLVETVQGYASHETESFRAVIEARSAAIAARGPAQQQQAEQQLGASLGQFFALAEAYPALRAVESFRALQDDLGRIEEALQNARRYFNAVVRDLNTAIVQFPSNLVAQGCGIQRRAFFELEDRAEAAVPKVSFGG
ncbi:LemA family protein [Cyanobium sp. Morenito 9A2]|uniref:LemA family protein n=1 Tax=Cyanobium sp. Morenito 9A2 TaxID=2823718 RepID=UPI0020CF76DD|nr:LemA family protein [Cyanobium sp. Morenito 9A2]MCP9850991.1 LemA family protein [Cyanobium sp. Morenito 9A2]